MKHFELPSFREWKAGFYEYRKFIGVYCCAVVRDPPDPNSTDTHSYTAAIAVGIVPERPVRACIVRRTFTCKDNNEKALIKWYNSLQKQLDVQWEKYISTTYLTESYKKLIQRNTIVDRKQWYICPICGEALSPTWANFCWHCGQRVEN